MPGRALLSGSRPTPRVGSADDSRVLVWLVLGSLVALVTVRFFTEVVPVMPRAANFIDVPMVAVLALAAMVRGRPVQLDGASIWLGLLSLAFLALAAVATLANLARVEIAPALVFVYGILGPLAVFFSVRRLWPAGGALTASRCIVALGALQLVVVAFIDLPRFIGSNDPDEVTGTFGTNAYQMVFFLILVVALLIGIRAHEPRRLAARVAPLMIFGCLAAIVLAQYRSLLLTSGLALVLAAALVSRSPRRAMTLGVTAVASFVVVLVLAAQYVPVLKVNETVELSPVELLEKRIEIADQLDSLYTSNPRFALTGTGPGTYSSRGWQTFALAESTSQSNVAGGLALALTGGGCLPHGCLRPVRATGASQRQRGGRF